MNISLIYVTTGNKDEAISIGKTLIDERLVACVNVIDTMTSIYRWENRICEDSESILICKTPSKLVEKVSEKIKSIHSYECPCIAAIPIHAGNLDFLKWVESETDL